jgi:hypothetical protein
VRGIMYVLPLSPICGSRTCFPPGRRETRFRLLWICSVVKIFCSFSSLRGFFIRFGGILTYSSFISL